MYNGKNYKKDGGDTLHIGGKLEFGGDAEVEGLGGTSVPAATTESRGTVLQGAAVANAAGSAPTAAEFKALLDSLRAAGIIATAT